MKTKLLLQNKLFSQLFILIALFFCVTMAGQTNTWNGSSDTSWNTETNWSLTHVPMAHEDVVIPNVINKPIISGLAAVCNTLTITNTVSSTNTLTINSLGTLAVSGAITIDSPTFTTGTVIKTTINVTSGTLTATSINMDDSGFDNKDSNLTIGATGVVNVSGDINMDGPALRNYVTFSGAGVLNIGGTISGGLLTPSTGTVNYNNNGDQTVGSYSYYNLTLSGSGTKTIAITSLAKNLTLSGSVNFTTGGNLTVGGILAVGSGTSFTTGLNYTLAVTGTTSIGGTFILANTASKTFTGNVTINAGGVWNETDDAPISYGGNLQNGGTYTAAEGIHTFSGTTKTISGANPIVIPYLAINGTTTNSAALTVSKLLSSSATLTNSALGALTIEGDSSITTLNNAGKTTINGSGTIDSFNNTAAASQLIINASPTITSLTATVTGNKVNYNGGDQTIVPITYSNLILSGSGTKTLSGDTASGTLIVNEGITFDLGNYTFGAPTATTLYAGALVGSAITGTGSLTLGGNITVNSAATGSSGASISCPIILGANRTFTVNDDGSAAIDLTISGTISGPYSVTKAGSGTLLLLSGNNTFNGTIVSAGTLMLGNDAALGTSSIAVNTGAVLDLNGFTVTNPLTLKGTGLTALPAGALTNTGSNASSYNGDITLLAASTITASGTLTINGTVSGAFGLTLDGEGTGIMSGDITTTTTLTKKGTGTWTMSGANAYAGTTTVNAGTLKLGSTTALGTSSATTVNLGAVLDLNGITLSTPRPLTLKGTGLTASPAGALTNTGDVASFDGNITLGANTTITTTTSLTCTGNVTGAFALTLDGAGEGTMSGIISGSTTTSIIKNGEGTWTLAGLNTYTGPTTVNAGTLKAAVATNGLNGAFGRSSAVTMAVGATLDVNDYNNTIGSINGDGNITLGSATLTINNTSPAVSNYEGIISGTGTLTKTGTGTLILAGANTYEGATNVSAGALKLGNNAALGATSAVTVNSGATLDLNGFTLSSTPFDLRLNGTGLALSGALTNTGTEESIFNGNIILGSATTITASGALTCTGDITGGFGLTLDGAGTGIMSGNISVAAVTALNKKGTGTWTLSGVNTYTGTTSITAGTLKLGSATALGAITNAFTIASGATADIASNVTVKTLRLGTLGTANATWGSTESTATYINDLYFAPSTAKITVTNDTRATPTVTPIVETYTFTKLPQGPNSATNTGTGTTYSYSYKGVSGTVYTASPTQPTNSGSYTVTVSLSASADGFYKPANSVATPFSIAKVPLTITANDASKCQGTIYTLGTTAFTAPELVGGETIDSVTLTSAGAGAGAAMGTYQITPSAATGTFSASNYIITYTDGLFTVNPLPGTIGTITEPTNKSANSTGNIFSIADVSDAASYSWTVSGTGWAITAGADTTAATITIGSAAGTISVTATNPCGTSVASIELTPSTPGLPVVDAFTQPTCSVNAGSVTLSNLPTNGTWTISSGEATVATGSGSTGTVTGLVGGTYKFRVTDEEGWSSLETDDVVINAALNIPSITIGTISQPTIIGGNGSFIITDYDSSYTYTITPATGVTIDGNNITAPEGTYILKAESEDCFSEINNIIISKTKTWIGPGTNWFDDANWTPDGVPTSTTDIIIPTGATITISSSTPAYANTLTVQTGATLIVSSLSTLEVTDKVTVDAGGTFNLLSGASLIQINDAENAGIVNVFRESAEIILNDYTYWSAPISGTQTLKEFSPSSNPKYFLTYDNGWNYVSAKTTFNPGVGYAIIAPKGTSTINAAPKSFQFTGAPNNGNISVPVVKVGTLGFFSSKLIGNPYPSAIDADKFIDANLGTITGTLYYWTHNNGLINGAYASNNYATYNKTGGTISAHALLGHANISEPGQFIASCQGFIVEIINSGNVVFTNAMRSTEEADSDDLATINSNFYKNANAANNVSKKNRIWLNFTNNKGANFSQTLLGYIETATNDYDPGFDGLYNNSSKTGIYSLLANGNYAIQAKALPFAPSDIVPLGYTTDVKGSSTISIDSVDGLFSNKDIFIEDKLLNVIHNLKVSPYTFSTEAGTFNNRFAVRYTNNTLGINDFESSNDLIISSKEHQIKIQSDTEIIDKVFVYDVLGREIYRNLKVNSNEASVSDLNNQHVLIVKIVLANGQSLSRKVVY